MTLTWSSSSTSLDVVDLFGLRYGSGIQLIDTDDVISIWSVANGLILELITVTFLLLSREVLASKDFEFVIEKEIKGKDISNRAIQVQ